MCSPGATALWERDVSPVPSRSNYAKVAFAQYPADIATCHWSIGELTAATSGADGKRRRVFKKVRLSGLGGAWGDLVVESSVALVCLYLHGCVGIVRVVSDNRPGYL